MIHFINPEKREKLPAISVLLSVSGWASFLRTTAFAAQVGSSSSLAQVNSYVGQGRWCKDEGDRCSNLIPEI